LFFMFLFFILSSLISAGKFCFLFLTEPWKKT
jgi:hypothetical protein